MTLGQNDQPLNLEELLSRPTQVALKQLKFRFYLALLLSNMVIFILMLPIQSNPAANNLSASSGNVILRLPLTPVLSLNKNQKTHVTLVDRQHHVQVTTAWIWDEGDEGKADGLTEIAQKLYSIELSPTDAAHLIHIDFQQKNLVAIPPIPFSQTSKENKYVEMLL